MPDSSSKDQHAQTAAIKPADLVRTEAAALEALAELKPRLGSLEAAELFLADGLALVRDHTGLPDDRRPGQQVCSRGKADRQRSGDR